MQNNISIRSILKLSWADFKREKKSLLILELISIVLSHIQGYVIRSLDFQGGNIAFIAPVVLIFLCAILIYGAIFTQNVLDVVHHRKLHWFTISLSVLKAAFITFISNLLTILLSGMCLLYALVPSPLFLLALYGVESQNWYVVQAILLTTIAIALCLYYLIVRCMFASLFILEQNCTISQALSQSWHITQDRFFFLTLFAFAIVGVLILGILALLIGIFVAVPVVLLMIAHLFKALLELSKHDA